MIFNPTASAVTPARLRVVERALEATFDLDVATTNHREHAIELAREAASLGAKAIVAFGGDGTVNEVVNGLVGAGSSTDVILGLLPGGGTNVLARALGYPNELVEATGHLLELVESGHARRIGLGRMHIEAATGRATRLFAQGCGLGLDAETVRRVEASGLRARLGDLAFVLAAFRAFRALRRAGGPKLSVRAGDVAFDAWWAIVANGAPMTYWGGRALNAAPDASHDRALDVLGARSRRLLRTLRWAGQALTTGRHVHHRDIEYVRDVGACEIVAGAPVGLQADGEYLGAVTGLRVEFLPEAIDVYASAPAIG